MTVAMQAIIQSSGLGGGPGTIDPFKDEEERLFHRDGLHRTAGRAVDAAQKRRMSASGARRRDGGGRRGRRIVELVADVGKALDHGIVGCHRQNNKDEDKTFMAKEAAQGEGGEAFRALHETNLAIFSESLGSSPDIADHERAGQGEEEDGGDEPFAAANEVGGDAEEEETMRSLR